MKNTISRRRTLHQTFTPRVLAASGLGLVALAASAFFSNAPSSGQAEFGPGSSQFLHDWTYSHGGSRHVQYDTHTGELLLVGEIAHGMDYYPRSGAFWWCSFGGESASPILSFLMREATVEHHDRPTYYPPGLELPYTDDGEYSLIRIAPLASQRSYVNEANAGTSYPDDYTEIPNGNLEFFLYQRVDGSFNIAVMDDGIAQEIGNGEAQGDGSSNRDDGVRIHIAFRARLPLPPEKLEWTQFLDLQSEAYDTEHPDG
ncbi:MAG TPA: hypothetical protein QF764_13795 [Planctomycetota bacterium]|nr:hypothetical protein [Planctomycetota bacterium]